MKDKLKKIWNKYVWYTEDNPKECYVSVRDMTDELSNRWDKDTWLQKAYDRIVWFWKDFIDFPGACCREVKYAYQRVTRGWSDRDCWSVGCHLSKIMPEMIKHLKEVKHGIPCDMFDEGDDDSDENFKKAEKKWDDILNTIIYMFEVENNIINYDYIIPNPNTKAERVRLEKHFNDGKDTFKYKILSKKEIDRYNLGWKYFKEHLRSMWD